MTKKVLFLLLATKKVNKYKLSSYMQKNPDQAVITKNYLFLFILFCKGMSNSTQKMLYMTSKDHTVPIIHCSIFLINTGLYTM